MAVDETLILEAIECLKRNGTPFEAGLSDDEIARVEKRFGFTFPPELRFFLQSALPTSDYYPNWRSGSDERLQFWLDGPIDGVLFDVENDVFWHVDWGPRPSNVSDAVAKARVHLERAPRLIPIGDRIFLKCVPEIPRFGSNPVFSIHQTDALHGGRDFGDFLRWFSRPQSAFDEDEESGETPTPLYGKDYCYIPFWTDLVRINSEW